MAFCTSCGATVDGAFCTKCGTAVGGPGGSSDEPRPSAAPVKPITLPSPGGPAPGKRRALFWILVGCLALVVIGAIVVVSTGIFVARKAGLDPALMEKNPGLAVAKMLASVNPDIEVLSFDADRGIIRVRDKKTGKTLTMNLEDAKSGKIVFQDDQDKQVEIQARGEGEDASLEVRSPEGTVRMGADAAGQLPDWLPAYPGAESTGAFGLSVEKGKSGSRSFKTGDSAEDVAAFYEGALKDAGFEVQKTVSQIPGSGSMIILAATEKNKQRKAHVTAAATDDGTTINLVFETR